MNSTFILRQKVSSVLASWNPIGVPAEIAREEYESYVEPIITIGNNPQVLKSYVKKLVSETMGLDYSDENAGNRAEIDAFVRELVEIFEQERSGR